MVRMLHLSDLHFALDAQSNNMQTVLLREAAAAVKGFSRHEKLLIVTGDFHSFKDSDYGKAEIFLKNLFAAMDINPAEGVFIIPGNHDVGNDASLREQIETEPHWAILQESALEDLKRELPKHRLDSLNLRLKLYKPYCDFVRRLGVYPAGSDLLPAQVHVRCWDGRLNILHLNTTLIYEPKQYDDQKLDAVAATGEEIWSSFDPALPALVLGHNSYYDLCEKQRQQLWVPFLARNVSAYYCGDTHRVEINPEHQTIPLEANQLDGVRIPNVVCAKGVSEENDSYSDFGFYWHDWDTGTDVVTYQFWRWRPEYGAEAQPDGKTNKYPMRRPDVMRVESEATFPVHRPEPDALHRYLDDRLEQVRRGHPSFSLMARDELDERLFPEIKSSRLTKDQQEMTLTAIGTRCTDGEIGPVWDLITESWELAENHSIVIEGGGGIGKTVTLLMPPKEKGYTRIPALYVPLYKLFTEDGRCLPIKDYLQKQQAEHIGEIGLLAARGWERGPSLLLLLDGFNEISISQQNEVFSMLEEWSEAHPGAQLIAVSRPLDGVSLAKRLPGEPISVTLVPQKRELVETILREKHMTVPPANSDIWDVLCYPLYLTLYMKADRLDCVTACGYPLKPRPEPNRGALIWNYLQRELLRKKRSEKWVFRCALCCEYILPTVAFTMVEHGRMSLTRKEIKAIAEQIVDRLDPAALPAHLSELFETYSEMHGVYPSQDFLRWDELLWSELGLLAQAPAKRNAKKADRQYSFLHQSFRDCLAGLYLVNAAEAAQESLPELWRRTPPHLALDYAAELMDEDTAQTLWEANRVQCPGSSAALFAQLELHRRRAGTPMELNFSGMDLRGLSLTRYGSRGERDLLLFRKPALSEGTKLDLDTFRGQGHTDWIRCVTATEDGLAVSGSDDSSLRVWDLRSGDCLHELKGHSGWIRCAAVTGDGIAISGSNDNTLRVWNLRTGDCLHELEGYSGSVSCVAVTKDGLAVSGSYDHALRIWDLHTGACLHELKEHTSSITCVTTTKDGFAVSGSDDSNLRVWDYHTGACLHVLKGHTNRVACVVATEDGLAVSGSSDKTLRIWDLRTGECLHVLNGHTALVRCVAATEDGLVVSGSDDDTLRVWDYRTGNCLHELEGHTGSVTCVAATQDGLAVSGSEDRNLLIWDLRTGDCLHELKGHTNRVACLVATMDDLIVSSSNDHSLRIWDLRTGDCLHELMEYAIPVACVAVTNDDLVVSGSDDNSPRVWDILGSWLHERKGHTLRIWDFRTGACLHELNVHADPITCVAAKANGLAVSGSNDSSLRVWDLRSGECLHELKGHTGRICCVAATEDGFAVSGSNDKTLRVWDLRSGDCLHELKGHTALVRCVGVTKDGLAVSGSDDGTLRVWDYHSGDCLHELKGHFSWTYCVAATGNSLAVSSSNDKTLLVWDLFTGECLHELKGHNGSVFCMGATEDGLAVSGSDDSTLRVWDLRSGACIHELKGHFGPVCCVAVTGGGHAISGSYDGTLRVWDLQSGACLEVLRTLTSMDVRRMDFSRAELDSETTRVLWQNGARLS